MKWRGGLPLGRLEKSSVGARSPGVTHSNWKLEAVRGLLLVTATAPLKGSSERPTKQHLNGGEQAW